MDNTRSLMEKVRPLYGDREPAHRFDHIERIMRFCRDTGKETGADIPHLLSSALFHGLKNPDHDDALHETLGEGYGGYRRTARRASRSPETLEERLLHDANLLDALGAVGLARAFMKGGYESQTLLETVGVVKLNMGRPLLTEVAKKVAVPKMRFMEEFLSRLERELEP